MCSSVETDGKASGIEAGLDYIFAFGKNYGVAAIQLAASRCPPDICIKMGSSHSRFFYQKKKDILSDVLFLLVGEAGLEPARPQ